MAKRSPILGYNHNVRYRGLVFHVQTEDSGLLSPHLFTHLFYGGVIISSRKLVYDAGAAEDSIKALMQAQHKAVLKDLKKGTFDDKIDVYLAGTEGLLPRGVAEDDVGRASDPALATPPTAVPQAPLVAEDLTTRQRTEPEDFELGPPGARAARTKTAERGSAPSAVRSNLPPPPMEEPDAPTLTDDSAASVAAAIAAANASGPILEPPVDHTIPTHMRAELSPLEIELELDEPDEPPPPRRRPRDTDISELRRPPSDGVPNSNPSHLSPNRTPGESVPPLPPPPHAHPRSPSSVGAASLPPKPSPSKMPSRPALTPPQVVSRPLTPDPRRGSESDGIEIYAPAPGSAELPGAQERPGQYAQHKRVSQRMPVLDPIKERTGSIPIPAGLGRPGRISSSPSSGIPKPVGREPTQVAGSAAGVPQSAREASSGAQRARTPTPSRTPPPSSSSPGVVMTRPAVIVGAPTKPVAPPRVRKAREDEGRGFGQGLISEKSLDEVILAYLSEDADDK